MTMARIPVLKTPKCLVGGAFVRSESGGVYPFQDADGHFVANIPLCTRKDLRNAVEAAAKGAQGWAGRSAYNRGQILYRLAEMLESRAAELAGVLSFTNSDTSIICQCNDIDPVSRTQLNKPLKQLSVFQTLNYCS